MGEESCPVNCDCPKHVVEGGGVRYAVTVLCAGVPVFIYSVPWVVAGFIAQLTISAWQTGMDFADDFGRYLYTGKRKKEKK